MGKKHYHVELENSPELPFEPLVTTDEKMGNATYHKIVDSLRRYHGLKTKFYGRANAHFVTGERVLFYSCEKDECLKG